MRNLLWGVILGLLAVVHSTPVNNVTQDPAKADETFLKDAMTEGFIIDPPPTLTTESPKINTTVQASQQPVSNSEDMIEGSAAGETKDMSAISLYATTPRRISRVQISESAESQMFEGSALGVVPDELTTAVALDTAATLSVTHAPTSEFTQSYVFQGSASGESPFLFLSTTTSVPSEARSGDTSSYDAGSQNPDAAVSSRRFPGILRDASGYGEVTEPDESSTMITNSIIEAEVVAVGSRKISAEFVKPQDADNNKEAQTQKMESEVARKGHVTPDWIIILGFIVGVAALVMLCVAIATRHKWNRADQETLTVVSSNSSNQQREQEMETFLPSDKPKENGNSAEYTVIPLEDLQKYDPSQ